MRTVRSLVASTLLLAAACGPSAGSDERPTVATTVYPLEYVAMAVARDRAEVVNVTPPGAEPHDVELTSDQVIEIVEADLVVYVGQGFQPAVEESLGDARRMLDAFDVVERVSSSDEVDAHLWLDPLRLAALADAVATELAEIDPDEAEAYRSAADDLSERLARLDEAFETGFADCRSDDLVTAHEAFAYLADRYGLNQIGITGQDPESEPSPQRIAEVVRYVRSNDVTTIFSETLVPPDAAETVARETGAEVALLDPLEGRPANGDYVSAMRENLSTLREALGCR